MSNRTAIVTGAARRIGAAIACELHRLGMDVIIHYHKSADDAQALAQKLNAQRPGSAHLLAADLGNLDACQNLIKEAVAVNNRLDVLVNNAAVFYATPLMEINDDLWDEFMLVNLKAPLFLSRAAVPALTHSSGCIINIADIHAERPLKNYPLYCLTKAGLVMLTRTLAKELGPVIRVNAISPGAILWPNDLGANIRKKILSRTALKRQGTVEDITRAIRYLVEDANYTTGEVLVIDGGRTLFS